MRATNSITQQAQQKSTKSFTSTINAPAVQNLIMNTLKDPRRAANFTSTMISVVNGSESLQQCEASSIISAALRGEALNLIYPVGEYSIVPYKNYKKGTTEAQFQISGKGILRLASNSGQYRKIILKEVREKEFRGYDPISDEPIIEFIHDEDEREELPIVGYYGRYILHNGFTNAIYWSHTKILKHANRYSKAFSLDTYDKLLAGKLDEKEAFKLRQGTPWYDDPQSLAHQKMCLKTIAKQLFNDGIAPLSVEMMSVLKEDDSNEQGGSFFSADDPRVVAANAPASQQEAPSAPEIVTEAEEVVMAPAKENAPAEAPAKEPAKAKAPARTVAPSKDDEDPFMNPPVMDSNGQMSLV